MRSVSSSDTVFGLIGNGFAIRDAGAEDDYIIYPPTYDRAPTTLCILTICSKCKNKIKGLKEIPYGHVVQMEGAITIECPNCNHIIELRMETATCPITTKTGDFHDIEIFTILSEMMEKGAEAWIDSVMQS